MKNALIKIGVSVLLLSVIGCKEQIIHNLSETESNRLITRLHGVGISAEKRAQADGTWALAVNRSDAIPALSALSDARVFRKSSFEKPESSGSMLPSRETQRFQFERAIAGEIEVTLSALHGVLESRVHLHLPPTDPLFGREIAESFPSSASVLLVTDAEFRENTVAIQHLVAGASGIQAERVSVLLSRPRGGGKGGEDAAGVSRNGGEVLDSLELLPVELPENKQGVEEEPSANTLSETPLPVPHEGKGVSLEKGSSVSTGEIPIGQIEGEAKPILANPPFQDKIPAPHVAEPRSWFLWGVGALLLLIVGVVGILISHRYPIFHRKRSLRTPRFEDQLQGLSFSEERAA